MFKGYYDLVSGMLTQGRRLDVVSNNMTNISTSGYKADRFTYSTFREAMWYRAGNVKKNYQELGVQSFMTAPSQLYTDYEQGSFDETGMPLDFGIAGAGFFAIQTEDGGRVYTRNGNFSLDDEGYLCMPGQGRVLGANEAPIQLGTDKIIADEFGGLFTEDWEPLGRVGVFAFQEGVQLNKLTGGVLVADQVGMPDMERVYHRMVERSNVDLAQQMVEMITSERAYQSMATVIKMYDQLIDKSTTDIGRLNG